MCVSAENARGLTMAGMCKRSGSNFWRQTKPARVEAVKKSGQHFALRIPLLQLQIDERAEQIVETHIVHHEAVELVPVDGNVALAPIFPAIFLKHPNSNQMRHDLGESVIVIAFHPDYFDTALRVGEFPDVAEKLPVLFF
jgi:hypothetical protein